MTRASWATGTPDTLERCRAPNEAHGGARRGIAEGVLPAQRHRLGVKARPPSITEVAARSPRVL